MKSFKFFFASFFIVLFSFTGFAQAKTETLKVAGNCGMCKNKIEAAAKKAGATDALWNEDSKELLVRYNTTISNTAKIEKAVAEAGYDTPHARATDAAYEKLHGCCKYDRAADVVSKTACCEGASCTEAACKTCCAEGKCAKGGDCCSGGTCTHKGAAHHDTSKGASCCKKA